MISFESLLDQIKQDNQYRVLNPIQSPQGSKVTMSGEEYINFSSNDYLGLAFNKDCILASKAGVEKWGTGSGASRLISGSLDIHHQLEDKISGFKKEEKSLIFSSGFQANLGIIQSLVDLDDTIFLDRYCHASLVDGARLSKAKLKVYPHLDMEFLERELQKSNSSKKLVITDTYFSMDGDVAPLDKLVSICKKNDAMLMVDDAHGVGVMGETGRGVTEVYNTEGKIDIVMGTFSKAIGSHGGFVSGGSSMIDYLVNRARTFIYTTGMSPSVISASLKAIDLILNETEYREKLWNNINYLRDQLTKLGYDLGNSEGPIIPIILGSEKDAISYSSKLRENKIYIPAIRPPTVSKGTSRLRVTVTAKHSKDEIKKFLTVLKTI